MFIVIEGIDGAGCQTQAELITRKLGNNTSLIKFPHYDTPVGKMIREFLYENKKLDARQQFLLYTLQFIFDSEMIRNAAGVTSEKGSRVTESAVKKKVLVADRYFTTTLCYQTLEGFSEEYALSYAKHFGIIKPDVVFFLDVKPEVAIKWKYGEEKELNFREKDLNFMKKTYEKYQDLANRQVWTKWIRINGEQKIEKVTQEIIAKYGENFNHN